MNVTLLVSPFRVTTTTFLPFGDAPDVIVNVAVTVVEFPTATLLTMTPLPDTVTAVAPARFVPVRVTGTSIDPVAGRVAELGEIERSVGPTTVNVTVLLVPPGVVTLTVLALFVAEDEIWKVALIDVPAVFTVKVVTVMPLPDTVTAEAPVRLLPVSVTVTVVFGRPVLGVIELRVGCCGAVPAPWNSIAPTSI